MTAHPKPGWVLLPDGHTMSARDFMRLYGAHLDTAPDAEIALYDGPMDIDPREEDVLDAEVIALTAAVLAAIPGVGKILTMIGTPIVGGVEKYAISAWIHGKRGPGRVRYTTAHRLWLEMSR